MTMQSGNSWTVMSQEEKGNKETNTEQLNRHLYKGDWRNTMLTSGVPHGLFQWGTGAAQLQAVAGSWRRVLPLAHSSPFLHWRGWQTLNQLLHLNSLSHTVLTFFLPGHKCLADAMDTTIRHPVPDWETLTWDLSLHNWQRSLLISVCKLTRMQPKVKSVKVPQTPVTSDSSKKA